MLVWCYESGVGWLVLGNVLCRVQKYFPMFQGERKTQISNYLLPAPSSHRRPWCLLVMAGRRGCRWRGQPPGQRYIRALLSLVDNFVGMKYFHAIKNQRGKGGEVKKEFYRGFATWTLPVGLNKLVFCFIFYFLIWFSLSWHKRARIATLWSHAWQGPFCHKAWIYLP